MTHPLMSKEELEQVYQDAWRVYYSPEHMKTVMRRAAATGISAGKILFLLVWYYGCVALEKFIRCRAVICGASTGRDRRPTVQRESPFSPFIRGMLRSWFTSTSSWAWRL